MLTARTENHFYGGTDLDDTIARLLAYRAAGADVVYAPHLKDPDQIRILVDAVDAPVNDLALRGGPTVPELAQLGLVVLGRARGEQLTRAGEESAVGASHSPTEPPLSREPPDRPRVSARNEVAIPLIAFLRWSRKTWPEPAGGCSGR